MSGKLEGVDLDGQQNLPTHKSKTSEAQLNENNATLTWKVRTDFTKRPVELVVDTGSQIGLTANDTIKENQTIQKPIYQLKGFSENTERIKTGGHLLGNFITDDNMKWLTQIHLIERKHAGDFDGYVGYDFLKKYGAKIDLHNKILKLHAPESSEQLGQAKKTTNDQRKKRVAFITPEEMESCKIPINNIKLTKCESTDNQCTVCEINERNIIELYKNNLMDASIAAVKPIPEPELARYHNESLKINDWDSEIMKLHKIENNKLRLPSHAALYLRSFPSEVKQLQTKQINKVTILPERSREENILTNLPMDHCSSEIKQKIENLVKNFSYQFYLEGDVLGKTDIIQHKIYLKPGTPIIHTKQFRLSEVMRRDVIREAGEMEQQEVIQRSISPYNSPAFMVKKKDDIGGHGDQRFVMNFIKVNENTEMRDFPIPRIEQLVDNFSNCRYFSTVDIKSAFHQIELFEPHREITAFTAGFVKYEWTRMPEGLCGAPLTMQEAVTRLLDELLEQGVNVFVDDVSIGTPDIQRHDYLLNEVFTRLRKHKFQVKLSKSNLYADEIEFLGYIVSKGCIKPNPNKVKAILAISIPINRKKLQTFLGMINYYRKFIPNLSHMAKPLNRLTSIKVQYQFDEECQRAFKEIKTALAGDVILRIPDFNERFYVSCDASNVAIGAVLAQGKPPNDKPIQFFSRSLNDQQQKWTAMERECLALVTAVKEFSPYLQGREFTLITDNLALIYINKHNDAYSKLFRMRMELMSYKYTIVYRPGVQNRVADALTRLDFEEEYDLEKFLNKYATDFNTKTIRAITRSGVNTDANSAKNSFNPKPFITCQNNMATEDDEYDHIFSLVLISNREMLKKIIGDEDIFLLDGLNEINERHHLATIKGIELQKN